LRKKAEFGLPKTNDCVKRIDDSQQGRTSSNSLFAGAARWTDLDTANIKPDQPDPFFLFFSFFLDKIEIIAKVVSKNDRKLRLLR